jgi:hypothetical protein
VAVRVADDGVLHGHAAQEHDVDQTLDGEHLGHGGQGRVLAQRVAGKDAVVGRNEVALAHVLEGRQLHQHQSGLRELSREQQTLRMLLTVSHIRNMSTTINE